jgi:translocation and assembly module TamB
LIKRILKWVVGILLALLAIPVVAVIAVMILANTSPGRHLIESQATSLTGGMVKLQGLGGRFPDRLRLGQIIVSDAKGAYVTVSDVALNWSPLRLLQKQAHVDLLQVGAVDVTRLPESSSTTTTKSSSGGSFSLPVRVDVDRLQIDKISIAKPVAGAAAVLAATGSAHVASLDRGSVQLDVKRTDSPGHYVVAGTLAPGAIKANLNVDEPPKGLISTIAHLPDLGAIKVQAAVDGPRDRLNTQVGINAGQLTASTNGTVDMVHQLADLTVKAQAPSMSPAPNVSWRSVLVDAHVQGSATTPIANGVVRIDGLDASGARVGNLTLNAHGNTSQVDLDGVVRDLHIPGPSPDLFAADPITLKARALLSAPDKPVTFAVNHPLMALDGQAQTQGTQAVQAHLQVLNLAPFAKAGGTDLDGKADLNLAARMQNGVTDATLKGVLGVTGGMAPVPALIGPDCHLDLAAQMRGSDITVDHMTVDGKALDVSAKGGLVNQKLDADWTVALADLAAIQKSISGKVSAKGHAQGPMDALGVQADIAADVAAKNYQPGHVDAHVTATDLPKAPHAKIAATGTLLDAPLALDVTAQQVDGNTSATIDQLSWKSLQAQGQVSLPQGQKLPLGKVDLAIARFADFTPLIGKALEGSAKARLDSDQQAAKLALTMKGVSVPGTAAVRDVALDATVTDPTGSPQINGTLTADGVTASSVKGASARATAKGPLDAMVVNLAAKAADLAGGPAQVSMAGTADAKNKGLLLSRLETGWKKETVRLLSPAKLDFADGVAIDRMRLGLRQAVLTIAGKAANTLDLTASLRNLPADIASIASPSLAMNGMINGDARITGTSSAPEGTIKVTASGVKLRNGPGAGLPPANLNANVQLAGTSAHVDTRLVAGPSNIDVTGTVPTSSTGSMNVKTDGRIDLAMLDPYLLAQGRRARGLVKLDAVATGTTKEPKVNGTVELTNGDVTDYALGAHVTAINALVQATGDTVRLQRFNGKAGDGTLGGNGTVGLAGDMPVDLHFTANNAKPLASDLMTAVFNADLTVQGAAKGDMKAAGTIFVKSADIRIPDKLPTSIAVLPVRDPNAPPPPPPPPPSKSTIALDLTIDAPEQVFVRGRGLFAEVGGKIHIGGTTSEMDPTGGLKLRRGQFSLIGATLNFTEGDVTFTGGGIANPSIHFVATSQTTSMTATLVIDGLAKDPKITLSSVPDQPQDEILAQLLFNTSTSKLSPLQLAELASALATLSGATSGGDPLESVRGALGLDRLAVGSDASGGATVEAGRYVARGVYVGAKQSATGNGTQATVQVDLYKGLKAEADAGTLSNNQTGSAAGTEGASVGLTYQFQY